MNPLPNAARHNAPTPNPSITSPAITPNAAITPSATITPNAAIAPSATITPSAARPATPATNPAPAAGRRIRDHAPLTAGQRRLVADNLGLVRVHLNRRVAAVSPMTCRREWDDLFQEGCLGLVQAAQCYNAQRGIPFAAFALTRIHRAVSFAIREKLPMIPTPRIPNRDPSTTSNAPTPNPTTPATLRLTPRRVGLDLANQPTTAEPTPEPANHLAPTPHEPDRPEKHPQNTGHRTPPEPDRCDAPERRARIPETVGSRIRDKYERAVHDVAIIMAGRASPRGDRYALVRKLVNERFLVPEEGRRTPYRAIARDTRSSYARVADCARRMKEAVRKRLSADPEFNLLQRRRQRSAQGPNEIIDDRLERRLKNEWAAAVLGRCRTANQHRRGQVWDALLDMSDHHVRDTVTRLLHRLTEHQREALAALLADES